MPRINGSEHDHPNPYINFIRVLGDDHYDKPSRGVQNSQRYDNKESARLIMRAIAAQVRPIMKGHGMGLNSFNEYEWNSEFAGRNWNGGEIIELVLRRKDGQFLPMGYLLTVMAHELAHIHHMNHGPQFQKLNRQLRQEIENLQRKGYYGPGFWSSGQRLKDSATLAGDGILTASDLPEYTCGGSHTHGSRRRVYRPKTTRRVTRAKRADRFVGEGQKLESTGSSFFRKRANAMGAKQTRALAAEQRARQAGLSKSLASHPTKSAIGDSMTADPNKLKQDPNAEESDDDEVEIIELEADWEDFDASDLKERTIDIEDEKSALRDEMKDLLATFRDPEQSKPLKQSTSTAKPEPRKIPVETTDDVVVMVMPPNKSEPRKRQLDPDVSGSVNKAPKNTQSQSLRSINQSSRGDATKPGSSNVSALASWTHGNEKIQPLAQPVQKRVVEISADTGKAKVQMSPSATVSCQTSWSCLICCEQNHVDLAVCGSCLRPRGTPTPRWD